MSNKQQQKSHQELILKRIKCREMITQEMEGWQSQMEWRNSLEISHGRKPGPSKEGREGITGTHVQ